MYVFGLSGYLHGQNTDISYRRRKEGALVNCAKKRHQSERLDPVGYRRTARKSGTLDKSAVLDEIAGIWSGRDDVPDLRELRNGWRRRIEE